MLPSWAQHGPTALPRCPFTQTPVGEMQAGWYPCEVIAFIFSLPPLCQGDPSFTPQPLSSLLHSFHLPEILDFFFWIKFQCRCPQIGDAQHGGRLLTLAYFCPHGLLFCKPPFTWTQQMGQAQANGAHFGVWGVHSSAAPSPYLHHSRSWWDLKSHTHAHLQHTTWIPCMLFALHA